MKKMIVMTALVLISSHAFAGDFLISTGESLDVTTVLPTASSLASSGVDKELMAAAHDDAIEFIRSEGAYRTAILNAAFNDIDAKSTQKLSLLKKAEIVIIIAEKQQ